MSDGNLTRMGGQKGACWMGSLINMDKFGKSKVAKKRVVGWVVHTGNIDKAFEEQLDCKWIDKHVWMMFQ